MLRGQSTYIRVRAEAVARELTTGGLKPDPGHRVLLETRRDVLAGWRGLADVLDRDGSPQLAGLVRRFAETMPPPLTNKEALAHQVGKDLRTQPEFKL